MTRRSIAIHMSITCAACICCPGRFAVGLVLMVESLLLALFTSLFISLLDTLEVKPIKESCICLFIITFVILYKQILAIFAPLLALQLSFVLFLPAVSTFSTAFLIDDKSRTIFTRLLSVIPPHLVFGVYTILFCAVRDILGFGTITFLTFSGFREIVLFDSAVLSFLATIPGALMLSALILATFLVIEHWYYTVHFRKVN